MVVIQVPLPLSVAMSMMLVFMNLYVMEFVFLLYVVCMFVYMTKR